MAANMGKDGGFFYPNTTAFAIVTFIDSWSVNASKDAIDVTGFGQTSRKRVAGLRDFSFDFSGTLDRSDTAQAAIAAQFESAADADVGFRLYATTSRAANYWSGSGVASNLRVDSRVGDKVSVSGTLQGDGALAWT